MLKKILYIAYVILMPVVVFFVIGQLNLITQKARADFLMLPAFIYNVLEYLIVGIGIAVLCLWKPKEIGKKASIIIFSVMTACLLIPIAYIAFLYSGIFEDGMPFVDLFFFFGTHLGSAAIFLAVYAANLIYTIAKRRLTAPVRSFYDN